jgi:hypothetical protein
VPSGYSPAQILHAYGIDQVTFNNGQIKGDGTGETIAIIDAYYDPSVQSDLSTFSRMFALSQLDGKNGDGSFTQIDLSNKTLSPPNDDWTMETALDVEWAHAVAPKANIVLVEAASDNQDPQSNEPTDLLNAVKTAASYPGVVVVSMSWGISEVPQETSWDSFFTTPGVTFVAASGDNGAGSSWPSASPNVVSVGGTTLRLTNSNTIYTETGWGQGGFSSYYGGSGGGFSQYESLPSYQANANIPTSYTQFGFRLTPDVAYVADPRTGVDVFNSVDGGWSVIGGTSAGAPHWAALIAIADQGRALANLAPLSSAQTLSALYANQNDFNDITRGSTGFLNVNGQTIPAVAGPGYDLVTGLGTPIANLLVPALASAGQSAASANQLFVTQMYQDLLGRKPDAAGLAYWTNLLDQGTSRSDVVLQIEQTPEYLGDVVQSIYQQMLHRPADPTGLAEFTAFLANGGTIEQVKEIIAGSAEYFQTRAGGQISAFLDALYADGLNRAVDAAAQAAFSQALAQGMSRQQVATVIFSSKEYQQDLIQSYYETYLRRAADSTGLADFVGALEQGVSDQQVIAALVGSEEYYLRL